MFQKQMWIEYHLTNEFQDFFLQLWIILPREIYTYTECKEMIESIFPNIDTNSIKTIFEFSYGIDNLWENVNVVEEYLYEKELIENNEYEYEPID
jgi:hypothetical protein